jgi:hypothetical protein
MTSGRTAHTGGTADRIFCGQVLWLVASAVAAELLVWVPAGVVEAGARSRIGVWCEGCEGGVRAEQVVVEGAPVVAARAMDDGTVRLDLGPPTADRLVVLANVAGNGLRATVPVTPPPAPVLELSLPAEVSLSEGRVELRMRAAEPVDAADVLLQVSEGEVGPVREAPGGFAATLTLAADRVARPLLVSAAVRSRPARPPAFASARLKARITGNVSAEAGSRISIRVGGRNYGPFVAGAEGAAGIAFDALPGESSYELAVADDLGNTQHLSQAVPASQRPVLLAAGTSAPGGAALWLAAVDARGAPWGGTAPACRSGTDATEAATGIERGRWRWAPGSTGGGAGTAVGCTLADTAVTLRLPAPPQEPATLSVRVYPDVLSADFPLAEVQATLLDARGERLPPIGVDVSASHGVLTPVAAEGVYRAEYDGRSAAALGGDELRARWSAPPGAGPPAQVRVCTALGQAGVVAVARALDGQGRPLPGVALRAEAGSATLPAGNTDARGHARWLLPDAPAQRVRVEGGTAAGEALARARNPGDPGCIGAAEPDRADLDARVSLPIRSGRVRQVFLDTDPRTLTLGPGATARIRVRMLDAAGGLVRDEPVEIGVSEGQAGPTVVEADGTLVAEFVPAGSTAAREVRISATTSAGTVSTTLAVAPRPVRGFAWGGVGWTTNFGAIASPWGSVGVEHRLPLAGLSVRGGVGLYGLDTRVESGDDRVHAEGTFVPIEVGVTLADRGPRFTVGGGLGVVVVPYSLRAGFEGGESVGGLGLAPPGVDAHGSVGWRLGQTELFAEVGYLLYLAPDGPVSLSGNAGGLRVIAGYRLLY